MKRFVKVLAEKLGATIMPPEPKENQSPATIPIDQYELEIDEQVNKFLELQHKLTFFLVTASIATLGFTLNQALSSIKDRVINDRYASIVLIVASVSALLAAGSALMSLSKESASSRLHLKYRYERKKFRELSDEEKLRWDQINEAASKARQYSFVLLVLSIALQTVFFGILFLGKGESKMHHYGKDSTEIVPSESAYEIIFTNKGTGQKIQMRVPRVGARTSPDRGISNDDVEGLANDINEVFRRRLD